MEPEINPIQIALDEIVARATEAADLFQIPLAEEFARLTVLHGFELGTDLLQFAGSIGPDSIAVQGEALAADYGVDFDAVTQTWIDLDADGIGDGLVLLAGLNVVLLTDIARTIEAPTIYALFEGFETDAGGWVDEPQGWFGTATQAASGTDGIVSAEGDFHAVLSGDEITAPYHELVDQGMIPFAPFEVALEIYLDPNADGAGWADGEGFDYSVAATRAGDPVTTALDFYFNLAQDASTGALLLAAGTLQNPDFIPRADLEDVAGVVEITDDGWYRFAHRFAADEDGNLTVDMSATDAADEFVFHTTLATAIPVSEISGDPRYAYFELIAIAAGLPVDTLSVAYDTDQLPPLPDLADLFYA